MKFLAIVGLVFLIALTGYWGYQVSFTATEALWTYVGGVIFGMIIVIELILGAVFIASE